MKKINVLLFENFETLDAFGPAEILGHTGEYELVYFSLNGGIVKSFQGIDVGTKNVKEINKEGILLVPGGRGVREKINDVIFLNTVKELAEKSSFCLSVCTGSALLAKCEILTNKKATSNKMAMNWVKTLNKNVRWIDKARWVVDGKFYTSSGVSAGMDMALGFISNMHGKDKAVYISNIIEYIWNSDSEDDIFFEINKQYSV